MDKAQIDPAISELLHQGIVIPAHPLALDKNRQLDERRQRALTRYYLDAGARGIAIGVHTTQFAIRDPKVGLFQPLLELAREEVDSYIANSGQQVVKISGILGEIPQAVEEASLAREHGYDAGLLSLSALSKATNLELIDHCRRVSGIIPIIGFYLQPAAGGRLLDYDFWWRFAGIENVVAIKIAPFNRYHTLDVVRGVVDSGRVDDIALYTGNDDNIVADLLTEFRIPTKEGLRSKRIVGGLLGHWAVWTKTAVDLLERIKQVRDLEDAKSLLALGIQVTDCNAAIFDAAHFFEGCIVGIHEILRYQGLLEGVWTLNPDEQLTREHAEEIARIHTRYPHLTDDSFVAEHLDQWLK